MQQRNLQIVANKPSSKGKVLSNGLLRRKSILRSARAKLRDVPNHAAEPMGDGQMADL